MDTSSVWWLSCMGSLQSGHLVLNFAGRLAEPEKPSLLVLPSHDMQREQTLFGL